METIIITAFAIGLLGSTHCLGMCGGIVGALNAGKKQAGSTADSPAVYNLSYNAGRITAYMLAGGLVGLAGALVSQSTLMAAAPIGRLAAGIIMIALGFYLAGWPQLLAPVEKAGFHLWRKIEPFGRRFLPANSPLQAYGLGLVWGWLPCGLVYSALALAATSASPIYGAAAMLAFGLGTLPMLLAMGGAANLLLKLAHTPIVRKIAGTGMILFGIYICFVAVSANRHGHMHAHHASTSSEACCGLQPLS